jgi:hypothetical protein
VTPIDEQELLRLTSLLGSIHERLDVDSRSREAVQKVGLALSVAFIHGLRPEVERLYSTPKMRTEGHAKNLVGRAG